MSDQEVAKCEECGKSLELGERVVSTLMVGSDHRRYWHPACLDASLTPIDQWPRYLRKSKS